MLLRANPFLPPGGPPSPNGDSCLPQTQRPFPPALPSSGATTAPHVRRLVHLGYIRLRLGQRHIPPVLCRLRPSLTRPVALGSSTAPKGRSSSSVRIQLPPSRLAVYPSLGGLVFADRPGALRSITLSLGWVPLFFREIAASNEDSGLSLPPCGGLVFPYQTGSPPEHHFILRVGHSSLGR